MDHSFTLAKSVRRLPLVDSNTALRGIQKLRCRRQRNSLGQDVREAKLLSLLQIAKSKQLP